MNSAPLPPHERSWRHPSEIGASTIEVEATSPRAAVFAGGAIAIAMIVVLAVALTPQQSTRSTTAIGATTVPPSGAVQHAANAAIIAAEAIRTNRLEGVTAIPSAIADIPPTAFRATAANTSVNAAVLPDLDDSVIVLTEQFAYTVDWRDVTRLDVTDAVVVDHTGTIVARFIDGRLVVSHDLLVGSTLDQD